MTFPAKVVHLGLEGIRAKWDEILADYDAGKGGRVPITGEWLPPREVALRRFAALGIAECEAVRWMSKARPKPKA